MVATAWQTRSMPDSIPTKGKLETITHRLQVTVILSTLEDGLIATNKTVTFKLREYLLIFINHEL